MISIYSNEMRIKQVRDWDEVMAHFDKMLGHWPKGRMRIDILKGRTVTIAGTHYRCETVTADELAYAA